MPGRRARREPAKRYHRFYGVEFGLSTAGAIRFALGGRWHMVPRSVVSSMDVTAGEMVVEEWWAKKEGIA